VEVRARADGPDRVQRQKSRMEECSEASHFYVLGPLGTESPPATTTHQRHRRGGGGLDRHAMLCYVTPKETPGLPNARRGARAVDRPTRSPPTRRPRRPRPWPATRRRTQPAPLRFDWNKQFDLFARSERAREIHDKTLPADIYKESGILLNWCGPKHLTDARPRSR